MTRTSTTRWMLIGAALALPLGIAACAKKPEVPPAPIRTAAEEACAAAAATATGLDASVVTVSPTASTKTGGTIYTAQVGDQSFTCVVEPDLSVSTFQPL